MYNGKKWLFIIGLFLLLCISIFASMKINNSTKNKAVSVAPESGVSYDMVSKDIYYGGGFAPPTESADSMVIASYRLDVESKSFDRDIDELNKTVSEVKGYISAHNISTQKQDHSVYKIAQITLRIPKDKVTEVIKSIRDSSYILTESSNSNDVTKQYQDLDATIKSLQEQEDKLNELFAQAKTVDEIVKLDEKVRTIIREKEELQRRVIGMRDEVAYSRLDITVKEVSEYTMTEGIQDGSFTRIKNAFVSSFTNIGDGITNVLVFFASIAPFIIGTIITVLSIYQIKRKRSDKRE